MAWRDRLRRRTAGPDTADRFRAAERAGSDGPSGDGQDRGASGGPAPSGGRAPSVPGDWDGGWRRTPPPQLTVARAPLGVSDGLAFRDGLAAWQNPSFDAGLGHALLPTAPTGLVRGVTPPAAAQPTRTGRGPCCCEPCARRNRTARRAPRPRPSHRTPGARTAVRGRRPPGPHRSRAGRFRGRHRAPEPERRVRAPARRLLRPVRAVTARRGGAVRAGRPAPAVASRLRIPPPRSFRRTRLSSGQRTRRPARS